MTDRRGFLRGVGAAALASALPACTRTQPPLPPGELLGPNVGLGHQLRAAIAPSALSVVPDEIRRTGVIIVGGGIAGLSAARRLRQAAVDDFLLLEMENAAGGNSRAGRNADTAFPWGAHYLPLPGVEARHVRELLAELGVLHGPADATRPIYDERYLCATPQERLFRDGLWEDGLLPHLGLSADERAQQERFQSRVQTLKAARGRDGRRVFALPMANASHDPAWRALDRQTFSGWLSEQGFTAPSLHWLANYACRDDYGTDASQTSAWAGLHYFACRTGEAQNAAPECVLTAPEGNAWLANGLARPLGDRLLTESCVRRVSEEKHHVAVDVLHRGKMLRIEARHLIWAAPTFLLPHVVDGLPGRLREACSAGETSPWLVANLHLDALPKERHGAPLAWDNVLYESPALGYIVATHQQIRRQPRGTVLTWYRALHELPPRVARQQLLDTPREGWAESILAELQGVHPDIRERCTRLDVFRHGHAMRRPTPGSLFNGQRQLLADFHTSRLSLAHSDLSGFSIFEEAQDRGIRAAERLLSKWGLKLRQ